MSGGRKDSRPCCYDVYVAAALGAFFLCIGDLIKNDTSSTVIRISEIIGKQVTLGSGPLFALILIVFLGAMICWVHSPKDRIEGFARGFSVFAVLSVAGPTANNSGELANVISPDANTAVTASSVLSSDNTDNSDLLSFFIPLAYAMEDTIHAISGEAIILLKNIDAASNEKAKITLRDEKTKNIVARQLITGNKVRIRKPYGKYLVEIEKPGFRRTMASLSINKPVVAYDLDVEKNNTPISLQKFIGYSDKTLVQSEIESIRYQGMSHAKNNNFKLALEKYQVVEHALPNDPQILSLKGYALFKSKNYDKAIDVLEKVNSTEPGHYYARLNLAKSYCGNGRSDEGLLILLSEPKLTEEELQITLNDEEFKSICSDIISSMN